MLLSLQGLSTTYGELPVLRNVSLQIAAGESVALLGPNGAGKSSVLKAIYGLTTITHGHIEYHGRKLSGITHRLLSQGIAYVPQGRRVMPQLSVYQNIELGGLYLYSRAQLQLRIQEVLRLFPILHEKQKASAGSLSGGQQQLLAIARGLLGRPQLMLLDEPSLGLSPKLVHEVFALIGRLNREEGVTILIVEHNLRSLLPIVDRAYVLHFGEIAFSGSGAEVINSPRLQEVFLGNKGI